MQSWKIRAALSIVLAAMFATMAGADSGGVAVGGKAKTWVRPPVVAAVELAVREAGWSLVPTLSKADSDVALACPVEAKPWTCVTTSDLKKLERMVMVSVDDDRGDDGSPILVVTARVANGSIFPLIDRRFCERCSDDALVKTAQDLTKELLKESAVRSGRTMLAVKSTPTGARVTLDGKPVGATDASFQTFPGPHTVLVELDGYQPETRTLEAEEGKTAEVSMTLRAASVGNGGRGRSRVVPGLVAGAGVTAIIAGVVLFAIDEDPSPTGDRTYQDTAPAGIALGVAGIAMTCAGATLWVRASKTRAAPVVASDGHTTFVGWAGRF